MSRNDAGPSELRTLQPVILAGGAGTRLWPLSRQHRPKQFLNLLGPQSLLLQTLMRLDGLPCRPASVICNEAHRFLAAEQLRQSGVRGTSLILESAVRNTAPAIALAAFHATDQGDDPLLLVLPADHLVRNAAAFRQAVEQGTVLADRGRLVTFGVAPDRAETGYGYIERGAVLDTGWVVSRFVEKPDAARAAEFLASGRYCWNSGIYLFRASRYLQELERFAPGILAACRAAWAGARRDLDFIRADAQAFALSPSDSIDYAVMEHTQDAAVVLLDAGWNDLGTWESLAAELGCDADGNCLQGDVLMESVHGTVVHAESRLVAAVGVQDLIIAETSDAVLVAHKGAVQGVKRIVAQLETLGRTEHLRHRQVYRPWGMFDAIGSGPRYQVKKITVNPGGRLSLQKHHHRAEHWVVVSGTAKVTNGDRTYLVTENQSTYIPIGQVHSLENPGTVPLELIEVQSGTYLGEDDIVRLEDLYGRV
ncbi:MAG: mannose-1-phosphate guanylyltransferase/mannose-6-phosphate isomerase [Castellaniella sp.]|uniref:mannose-1-phosphate guanylyltransferase/mannose-6-phosphate isomerase n=1 Tax=Castellaniella sp. TaxID=1955812 RepID=UPI0012253EC0|nr:mannose-1-phosphate guanylyltransferase/mannose-6-phosphate isomerase [Castellaniella sp.]TAN25447.1 MAG: mannose-1-phosphate guanylyltransferase/mannose-6-phosphate isomerase [Castellaniella sp.]